MQALRRTAGATAILALLLGGANAVHSVWNRPFVREFQAGDRSQNAERWIAIGQQSAIEIVGFAALGLVLAIVARVLCGLRRDDGAPRGQHAAASFLLVAGAFVFWIWLGTWFTEVALPFLAPLPLLWTNLAGFGLSLLGFFLFDAIARRLPWAPRAPESPGAPAAIALCSAVCACIALHFAMRTATRGTGGYKDPVRLAQCAGYLVAALCLAPALARPITGASARLVERLGRGPLLPKLPRYALGLVAFGCIASAVPFFQMSAVDRGVTYETLNSRGTPDGPNVVIVTIDTLRADHLGCYGYDRPTSPLLDAVAAEGVVCEDPSAAASWTKPATGTILTGLHPSRHGALYHGSQLQLPEGERTLAEAFRDAGYVTAGFVSNPNLKKVFLFDRGFDLFFDSPVEDTVTLASIRSSWFGKVLMRLMRHQFNWKYENDVHQMNRHVLSWIDENKDNRFFLYAHYIDPHIPYAPPEPHRSDFAQDHGMALFNERKEKVGIDLYDAEIRYMDDGFGDLVERLKEHGLWENTLLVVTSDHGEEFFEHGVLGHGFSLYQPVVGVPLIFHGPGVAKGHRIQEPVQILDMPSTVLELAGTGDERLGDGRSFAQFVRGEEWETPRTYFIESEFGHDEHDTRSFVFTGVREGRWKLVLTEANAYFPPENPKYGREALYDLENDPGETQNLFHEPEHRELVQRLLGELLAHSEHLSQTGFRDVEPAALDAATQESLRALGYL